MESRGLGCRLVGTSRVRSAAPVIRRKVRLGRARSRTATSSCSAGSVAWVPPLAWVEELTADSAATPTDRASRSGEPGPEVLAQVRGDGLGLPAHHDEVGLVDTEPSKVSR